VCFHFGPQEIVLVLLSIGRWIHLSSLEWRNSSVSSSRSRISKTLVSSASLTSSNLLPAYIICNSGLQSAQIHTFQWLINFRFTYGDGIIDTSRTGEDEAHWVGEAPVAVIQLERVDKESWLVFRQVLSQLIDINVF